MAQRGTGGYSDESRYTDIGFGRLAGGEEYSEEYFSDPDMEDDLAEHGVHRIDEPSIRLARDVLEGLASGDD